MYCHGVDSDVAHTQLDIIFVVCCIQESDVPTYNSL